MIQPLEIESEGLAAPMPTKLLALDQATRTTGYSVLEDERLVKVNHFTLDNPDMGVRLH